MGSFVFYRAENGHTSVRPRRAELWRAFCSSTLGNSPKKIPSLQLVFLIIFAVIVDQD